MLDQLKTSLEKLYLKNVNFSSGETITSIPQMNKLKSGIVINRTFFIEQLDHFGLSSLFFAGTVTRKMPLDCSPPKSPLNSEFIK